MAGKISPNKLNKSDKRHMENVRSRLRSKNVGEDNATRLAMKKVSKKQSGLGGGKNAGAEPQKRTIHGGRGRTGSKSNASK